MKYHDVYHKWIEEAEAGVSEFPRHGSLTTYEPNGSTVSVILLENRADFDRVINDIHGLDFGEIALVMMAPRSPDNPDNKRLTGGHGAKIGRTEEEWEELLETMKGKP